MPELTLNISPPPPPTLVLDISPPQGPEGPQGNTGPQGDTGPVGPTGPQPDLSADTPEDLGTAAAGVGIEASRSDHVHAMPSAADVGALPVELIGLTPEQTDRGVWDENETYTLGDVVFSDGFWVGVSPVVGSRPGDVSGEWDMLLPSTHIGVGAGIGGIGDYSTAVGVFSHASGEYSTALGVSAHALGDNSTALGVGAHASGEYSTAFGFRAEALGDNSTAFGFRAEALGDNSTALGYRAEASGEGDVNLANLITGHIDTSMYAADALTLPTGFADLPHTDASSNPNVDSSRLISRSDGLAVRDNAGTETKLIIDTDARLTDARTPLAHTHGQSDVTGLVADMAAKQPLDSDLTAIAALSTTAFGRSLLEVVDAVGGRAALSAAAASHAHSYNYPCRVGQWYCSSITYPATYALNQTEVVAIPIVVDRDCVIDEMTIEVVTPGGGGKVHLGIYSDDEGIPAVLLGASKVVTTDTAALKIATGIGAVVPAGRVWLAVKPYYVNASLRAVANVKSNPAIPATISSPYHTYTFSTVRATYLPDAIPSVFPSPISAWNVAPHFFFKAIA